MLPVAILKTVAAAASGGGSYSGGSLDTQTVTSGASGTAGAGNRKRGFILGSIGSCSTGNSAIYSGAAIRELASEEETGNPGTFDVILTITGVVANSGWTSINVGGNNVLLRSSATFSTTGGNSTWTWAAAQNPFGTSGTRKVGFD